jgi:mono/diheme cytochrome c family protein
MRALRWTTVAMLSCGSLALAALAENGAHAGDPAADPVPTMLASPADLARGKAIFTGTCGAYCHKMAPGPGDAPYLFDCNWLHGGSDAEIFQTISKGVPGSRMMPFGGALKDPDIWRLVGYLRSASTCSPEAKTP